MSRCAECNQPMHPVDAAIGRVCLECTKANHARVVGRKPAPDPIKYSAAQVAAEIARLQARREALYHRLPLLPERERQLTCLEIDENAGAIHALQWLIGQRTKSTYSDCTEQCRDE